MEIRAKLVFGKDIICLEQIDFLSTECGCLYHEMHTKLLLNIDAVH